MAEQAQDELFEVDGKPIPDPKEVQKTGAEDDIEIELIDDTPPEDQRDPPRPASERIDPDSPELKKEVEGYSDKVQQRIKQLKYEFHEERRAKDTASKQAEEALRYAEQVNKDNQTLRSSLNDSNSAVYKQFDARADAELEAAQNEFRTAYDAGDTDKIVEAQTSISRIQAEKIAALQAAPQAQVAQETAPVQQQPSVGVPDQKATGWLRENRWFQTPGHEDMTGYALGLHQKLISEGLDPRYDEKYYKTIDGAMQTAFPSFFGKDQRRKGEETPPTATSRKSPPPVGGPSRGAKTSRKVQLTPSAVAIAKRLGVPLEIYAKQVAKEQLQDG